MKAVLISLLILGSALAQPPPAGQTDTSKIKPEDKCSVEGKVLNGITGEPLKKTHVSLRRMDSTTMNAPPYGAITDAAGHFIIEKMDPGRYHMSAERAGFVRSDQSSKKLTKLADTLTLSAGQKLSGLESQLIPQGVIAGRVVDEDNDPVMNARVQCLRYRYLNGKKTLAPTGIAMTNDKGEFRAFGLAAGKYFVSASYAQPFQSEIRGEPAADAEYVQTYYPNAVDTGGAMQVAVTAGAEMSGIDIRLARTKTFSVSGTVGNRSKPSSLAQVALAKRDNGTFSFDSMRRTTTDSKGHFVLHGVLPGAYELQAVEFSDPPRVTLTPVNVGDANIDGLQVALGVNPDMSGVFTIENAQNQQPQNAETTRSYRVFLMPETNMMMFGNPGGEVKEDGTFTLRNIAPLRYRLQVSPLEDDVYVKHVTVGDKEMPEGRLDFSDGVEGQQIKIVLSMNGGHIEGAVMDDKQQPLPHSTVVLIPDQADATQRYRLATTDQNGHYVLRGLAPGKYKLYAFDQIDSGGYYDADYMKPFESKGEEVEVSEGSKVTHDLQLIVNDEEH